MQSNKTLLVAILATSISGLVASTASAQNPGFDNGEGWLILGIQGINGYGQSGTRVLEVSLGDATTYRDATANIPNIINIGALLTTFQATSTTAWYDSPDVFAGIATVWNNTDPTTDPVLRNGDPSQTLYLSKARNGVGSELYPNSTINNISSGTSFSGASNSLISLQNRFESNGTSAQTSLLKSLSNTWEDQNLTNGSGTQSTAYSVLNGIQYRFGSGDLAYSIGNVEAALDLYRFQRVNDIPGQFGENIGGQRPIGPGEFQGTFVIAQDGNVSFIFTPIPEPSSALAFGGLAVLGLINRRRRTVVA